MRTIQSAAPRRELRDFVRVFAQRMIPQGTCTSQANVATLEQVVAFYLGTDLSGGSGQGKHIGTGHHRSSDL